MNILANGTQVSVDARGALRTTGTIIEWDADRGWYSVDTEQAGIIGCWPDEVRAI